MADNPTAIECGSIDNSDARLSLRVASIFIIMVTGTGGALLPIVMRLHVSRRIFDFIKCFGSGVIIATAFIHLLAPANDALKSPCLTGVWTEYDWAPAIAMMSVFALFHVELVAFRWGTARLRRVGAPAHDAHGHGVSMAPGAAHGPEPRKLDSPVESLGKPDAQHSVLAQTVGIAILEFGVVFHSVLIGLALAVDPQFIILFVVIIFHQTFEALGLGARLAHLQVPQAYSWVRVAGALLYGITTPVGIAAGLGVRSTYNPGSTTASIVSGIFDATSAGILLYTGLVELLAHEFLFNPEAHTMSNGRVAFMCGSMLLGAGLMALLGKWA